MESREEELIAAEPAIQKGRKELKVFELDSDVVKFSKVYRVKGVVRSLVTDALKALDDMYKECEPTPELTEKYYLVHHYLDYLKRFSEGRT